MARRLYKGRDKKLFGVCSGLGNYFNIDPTLIRVLFVFAFLAFGSGLLLYIILAIVMPDGPRDLIEYVTSPARVAHHAII